MTKSIRLHQDPDRDRTPVPLLRASVESGTSLVHRLRACHRDPASLKRRVRGGSVPLQAFPRSIVRTRLGTSTPAVPVDPKAREEVEGARKGRPR